MEFLLGVIYIFTAIYTLYFLALALRNLSNTPFNKEASYSSYEDKENMAIVIYAHNNKSTLANLVQELKSQNYPINKFRVFVLLDNCNDGSQELFEQENFIHVIDIKGVGTIGKDQAIATLLEKLSDNDYIESYVFLDADRSISSNFLSTVNAALKKDSVISGETVIEIDCLGFVDRIKAAYQKYHMNFIRRARSLFGLAAQADSGVFIIKNSIVKEIGDVDFKNINSELKYSLLLSKIQCRCTYNPDIQTIVHPANYIFRKPRISYRLDMFKNCIPQMFTKNFVFTEHSLSLLYPNIWLLMIIYFGILKYSFTYHFVVDFKIVLLSFLVLIASFGLSLINTKMTMQEIGYLFLYPSYSFCHIIANLPPIRFVINKIKNRGADIKNSEKFIVDVIVTVGKNNLNCKLEFISQDGLSKIKFIYKNKSYTTASHIRMIDALQELKMKLDDYGYILRICNCCSHFHGCIDGSTNMLRGFCTSEYPSPSLNEPKPTLIWNTCSAFTPAKLNNIISEMIKESSNRQG